MITIDTMSLDAISRLDNELGYNWREGQLYDCESEGCATVRLGSYTILKAYSDGAIFLDLGGIKATLEHYEYYEVRIE